MSVGRGVSYFGNRYPAHARTDLRAMAAAGVSYVVHVMSEADVRWNPRTIAQIVAIGHEEGIESWLDPWGVGGVFGGEAASYAVGEYPNACQRDAHGSPLPALCPLRPEFRWLMEYWLDAAVASGASLCLWDEPHLFIPRYQGTAERWACRCAACQAAFAERFDHRMPTDRTDEVDRFVKALLDDTLAWLVAATGERGMQSGIVLLPEGYDADTWRTVAALPGVRAFGTDPYWFLHEDEIDDAEAYVRLWSERTVAATAGSTATPLAWVQAFRVPAGREPEIERMIEVMVDAGIRSVAAWSYLGCAAMSHLAADDPDAVWAALSRAFTRLRDTDA